MPEKDETHCFVGSAHDKCGRCSATTCKRAASGRNWMAERAQPRDCHVLVMETQLAKSHPPTGPSGFDTGCCRGWFGLALLEPKEEVGGGQDGQMPYAPSHVSYLLVAQSASSFSITAPSCGAAELPRPLFLLLVSAFSRRHALK